MYVISEEGIVGYVGGQIQEKIDDIKATAQFAHDHLFQASDKAATG